MKNIFFILLVGIVFCTQAEDPTKVESKKVKDGWSEAYGLKQAVVCTC